MSHTVDDAKSVIYDTVLHRRDGTAPEDTPVIFDEYTVETTWGWIFHYNNERFRQTREVGCQWVGHGPIFFNRQSGEIRQFGSGCNLDHELQDYENELAARDGSWCLWLSSKQERSAAIVRVKTAFAINTAAAKDMVPSLPHCLFSGVRRHLEWVATHLNSLGVSTEITIEQSAGVAQTAFELPEQMINPSLAQAYHQRWDV
jgi:hypothetical protein